MLASEQAVPPVAGLGPLLQPVHREFNIYDFSICVDSDSTSLRICIIQNGPFVRNYQMPPSANAPAGPVEEARRLFRLRRMRDQAFGPELFGEPAWDLLLDLYVAASEPRSVSIIAVSIAASTDDVRWLDLLEEHGLVNLVHAGSETNRAIVTLSQTAFDQMTRLLEEHRERPS